MKVPKPRISSMDAVWTFFTFATFLLVETTDFFSGSFGICQETQKPIKKTRLKVVPFTRFSLEGQTLYEKRKRKDVDSGGGTFATIADSTMGVEE